MKSLLFLSSVLFCYTSTTSQINSKRLYKTFYKDVVKPISKQEYYNNKVESETFYTIKEKIKEGNIYGIIKDLKIHDSIYLTKSEVEFIKLELDRQNADTRSSKEEDLYNGGSFIHQFILPIFLRDFKYCLYYEEYGHCGGLCGGGNLSLFKLVKGKWYQVAIIYAWIA